MIGIEADKLRIVDDAGEPILFTPKAFEFIDATVPTNWISKRGDDGELYAYPQELRDPPCFFEKFFDRDMQVRAAFHAYMHTLCWNEIAEPTNEYIRLRRSSTNPDDPVTLYSELDDDRNEVRRVEVFANGQITFADAQDSTGRTQLATIPMPPLADLAKDPQSESFEIDRDEFEAAWTRAQDAYEKQGFGVREK